MDTMRKKDQVMVKDLLKKGLQFVDPSIFAKTKSIMLRSCQSLDVNENRNSSLEKNNSSNCKKNLRN